MSNNKDNAEFHGLAIKYNNAGTKTQCAICGALTDPSVGPALFMADSFEIVCFGCGRKYSPELVEMLDLYFRVPTGQRIEK